MPSIGKIILNHSFNFLIRSNTCRLELALRGGVRANAHVSIFHSISANEAEIHLNQQVGGRYTLEALPFRLSKKYALNIWINLN